MLTEPPDVKGGSIFCQLKPVFNKKIIAGFVKMLDASIGKLIREQILQPICQAFNGALLYRFVILRLCRPRY